MSREPEGPDDPIDPPVGPAPEAKAFDEELFRKELESEFSAIRAEIDRINVQEKVGGAAKRMILNRFRDHRRKSRRVQASRPEWRVRLDEALEGALDKLIEDGLEERPDGTLQLTFHSGLVGTHGIPLLTAVLDGLRAKLLEGAQGGGPLAGFAPAIARAIEQFRTSFAGAPPPEAASTDAAVAEEPPASRAEPPPATKDPFAELFKGFAAMAQQSAANKKGGKSKKSGGKGPARTVTTRFEAAPPGGAATGKTDGDRASETAGAGSKGPTVQIDFAGLLGAMFQGLGKATQVKAPPADKGAPAASKPDSTARPGSEPVPEGRAPSDAPEGAGESEGSDNANAPDASAGPDEV